MKYSTLNNYGFDGVLTSNNKFISPYNPIYLNLIGNANTQPFTIGQCDAKQDDNLRKEMIQNAVITGGKQILQGCNTCSQK